MNVSAGFLGGLTLSFAVLVSGLGEVRASNSQFSKERSKIEQSWKLFDLETRKKQDDLKSERKKKSDLIDERAQQINARLATAMMGGQNMDQASRDKLAEELAEIEREKVESNAQFNRKISDLEKERLKKRAEFDLQIAEARIKHARASAQYKKRESYRNSKESGFSKYKIERKLQLEKDLELEDLSYTCDLEESRLKADKKSFAPGIDMATAFTHGAVNADSAGNPMAQMANNKGFQEAMVKAQQANAQKDKARASCKDKRRDIEYKYEKRRLEMTASQ